ncbi:MAG TPA: ferritin [Acidobacteria bacterium]|nr:ferritin [Acidobacteriota bacterium]
MLSETIEKALNEQTHAEFYSSYLYLAVAAWFNDQQLDGFATWMEVQAREEFEHGMKLFHHIMDRGGTVVLEAIDKPPATWGSPSAAVKAVLDHERYITGRINDLANLANQENDHATSVFLHWYIAEQVEEESTADRLYHRTAMLDDSPHGLLMLDRELAARGNGSGDED